MEPTGHYQDIAWRRVSRISGQTPPTFSPFTRLRQRRHAPTGGRSDLTEPSTQLNRCSTAGPVRATSSLPAGYALAEIGRKVLLVEQNAVYLLSLGLVARNCEVSLRDRHIAVPTASVKKSAMSLLHRSG